MPELVRNYRSDKALAAATPAAVRDGLSKVDSAAEALAAALAELPAAGRALVAEQVQDVDAKVTEHRVLSARAGAVAADLTSKMVGGGRRSVLTVMGHGSPKVRLLRSVRKTLSKDMPNPTVYEIVAAAAAVLAECGESDTGLRHLQYRLAA